MRHPLPGEEAVPDCGGRRPGDGGVPGADAARSHADRGRRLLLQGLCRGHGDHPLHAKRECRAQSYRNSNGAQEQTRTG